MSRQIYCSAAAVLLVCLSVAAAADAPAKPQYDLRFRPQVGLRFAYEQTLHSEVQAHAAANGANRSADQAFKSHRQMVVQSEEITELRDGQPVAKRFTFGPNCWWASKDNDKPTRKVGLIYSNKTVNIAIAPDGSVQQDFGVKPSGETARLIRASIKSGAGLLPNKLVTIGERWRGDEGLRPLLDLRSTDTVSAIMTLKAVREQDGRQVADVGVSAGIITKQFGFNLEISIEGTLVVDMQTGLMIGCDLTGKSTLSGGKGDRGNAMAVSVTGSGTLELHQSGKFLPAAPAAADIGSE